VYQYNNIVNLVPNRAAMQLSGDFIFFYWTTCDDIALLVGIRYPMSVTTSQDVLQTVESEDDKLDLHVSWKTRAGYKPPPSFQVNSEVVTLLSRPKYHLWFILISRGYCKPVTEG